MRDIFVRFWDVGVNQLAFAEEESAIRRASRLSNNKTSLFAFGPCLKISIFRRKCLILWRIEGSRIGLLRGFQNKKAPGCNAPGLSRLSRVSASSAEQHLYQAYLVKDRDLPFQKALFPQATTWPSKPGQNIFLPWPGCRWLAAPTRSNRRAKDPPTAAASVVP